MTRVRMKMNKMFFCNIVWSTILLTGLSAPATARDVIADVAFLQKLQDRLTVAAGLKVRSIRVIITPEKKRLYDVTPSKIILSHGFIQQITNQNQMVATLAHMTAHINMKTTPPPPLPKNIQDKQDQLTMGEYIKSALRPRFPDNSNPPKATAGYDEKGATTTLRPSYYNSNYDYQVNKANILKAEQEIAVDRIALKILHHAGFCPDYYGELLHYFYDHPEKMIGNKHFALSADQWQRIDMVDQITLSNGKCSE